MNPNELENLRQLVQKSPLLDAHERIEWLSLMDLMNDKQLLELEKILTSYLTPPKTALQQKAVASASPVPQAQPMPKITPKDPSSNLAPPKFSTSQKISSLSSQTPAQTAQQLRHIMNLPHVGQQGSSLRQSPLPAISPQKVATSGFMAKIKNMLAEKELPPPEVPKPKIVAATPSISASGPSSVAPSSPASFAAAPVKQQPSQVKPLNAAAELKPNPPKEIKLAAESEAVGTLNIHADQIIFKSEAPSPQHSTLSSILREAKQPSAQDGNSPMTIENVDLKDIKHSAEVNLEKAGFNSVAQPDKNNNTQPEDKVLSGLSFVKTPRSFMSAEKATIKATSPLPASAPAPSRIYKGKGISVGSLNDLTGLDTSGWRDEDPSLAAGKITKLIHSFGYHEVIFNLEKSPLYKAYLNTGMELLKHQGSFEALKSTAGSFLSRDQFEGFADLLRQIQGG